MLARERLQRRHNSRMNHKAIDGILTDLVNLRKKRGCSQSELAELMGVTQSYVSQIENGHTGMFDNLVDFVQSLNGRLELRVKPSEEFIDDNDTSADGNSRRDSLTWSPGDTIYADKKNIDVHDIPEAVLASSDSAFSLSYKV